MADEPTGTAPDLGRFRLKRPCKHCPFRNDETRIRFRCRDRAVEIEEQAYRQGFPCHETADYVDDPEGERDGYVFGDDSSFCIGYVILQLKANGDGAPWPAIHNDEQLLSALALHLGDWWDAPVFETEEEFFEANESRENDRREPGDDNTEP